MVYLPLASFRFSPPFAGNHGIALQGMQGRVERTLFELQRVVTPPFYLTGDSVPMHRPVVQYGKNKRWRVSLK